MDKDSLPTQGMDNSQQKIVKFNGEEFLKISEVAQSFVKKGASEKPPQFVILMGGIGSGKTTLRKRSYSQGYVHFDPSDIYAAMKKVMGKTNPKFDASVAFACGLIVEEAIKGRKNIVTEIIGDDTDHIKPIIEKMTEKGYKIHITAVTADVAESYKLHLKAVEEDPAYLSAYFTQEITLSTFYEHLGLGEFLKKKYSTISEDESIEEQIAEIQRNSNMFPEGGINYRMAPDAFDKILAGEACDEVSNAQGEFGRDLLNPIPVNGILGEVKYLSRLCCECGNGLLFHRLGSCNPNGIDIDVYETVCVSGQHWDILYLDFYHPRRSRKLPIGFRALPYNKNFTKLALTLGTNKRTKEFPYDLPEYVERHSGMKALANKCKKIVETTNFERPSRHLAMLDHAEYAISASDPREQISERKLLEHLLGLVYEIETKVVDVFANKLKNDKKKLQYEARIFALWLVTISLPPNNNKLQDDLHDFMCETLKLDKDTKELFFKDIDKRYRNYFAGLQAWSKNPGNNFLGSVIVEIIVNQNPNFSLANSIPQIGDIDAMNALVLFGDLFKFTLKTIKTIMKNL